MLTVTPMSASFGADITGVDLKNFTDEEFKGIYKAWLDYSVLRFRRQPLNDDELQRFSSRFGPLEEMPMGRRSEAERKLIPNRYVTVISNILKDDKPIGGLGNSEANWHSDMTYIEVPPPASILLGVEIPANGGNTHFANQYAALESLPDSLRKRIQSLKIKHDAAHTSIGRLRYGFEPFDDPRDAPGAIHPIIRTHNESGREALYLGRREWAYIDGLPLGTSESLLDELWAHAAKPENTLEQIWQPDDLVIWDNRCVLHRRDDFPQAQRRMMRRCQVLDAHV